MTERDILRKIMSDDQRRKYADLARSKVDKTTFYREPYHLTYLKRVKEKEKAKDENNTL